MPRIGQIMMDLGCLTRFKLIGIDSRQFWVDLEWFWVDMKWFWIDMKWLWVDMKWCEMIWNWCERGCELWWTLLRYDQVGQKIRINGLRKWDELVWRSNEIVDANHFWASRFCLSLIQCDLEHCVKE